MTLPGEQEIVDAVRRGDAGALGGLLELHQNRIFNTCLRMVTNRDDAAEVAQETMLKVIEHIDDFHGDSGVATWMTRIAMNLCISHLRKRKLRQTTSLDAAAGNNGGGNSGGGGGNDDQTTALRHQLADHREPSPDSNVQQAEMFAHLQTALGRVEEEFRAVLVLRDIEEMDYQQIADVLAIPVGTVKSRLFRARLSLRREVLKIAPPPPRTGEAPHGDTMAPKVSGV